LILGIQYYTIRLFIAIKMLSCMTDTIILMLAELVRGKQRSLAQARSEAWKRGGLGGADWSLEVLDGVCPTGNFLWLAVLAASGCVDTMVRWCETTETAGGGGVEESGDGGGGDRGELEGGRGNFSLDTVLSYIASTSANKAWCCEALASRRC
jgi:hypothetical protein